MSEFGGLWKHEHSQHALVSLKTECGCPSGGGIENRQKRRIEKEEEESSEEACYAQAIIALLSEKNKGWYSKCVISDERERERAQWLRIKAIRSIFDLHHELYAKKSMTQFCLLLLLVAVCVFQCHGTLSFTSLSCPEHLLSPLFRGWQVWL